MWLCGTTNTLSRGSEGAPRGHIRPNCRSRGSQPRGSISLACTGAGGRLPACRARLLPADGATTLWWTERGGDQERRPHRGCHLSGAGGGPRSLPCSTLLHLGFPDHPPLAKPQTSPPQGYLPAALWLLSPRSSCPSLRPLPVFPNWASYPSLPLPTGLAPSHCPANPNSQCGACHHQEHSPSHETPSLRLAVGVVIPLLRGLSQIGPDYPRSHS